MKCAVFVKKWVADHQTCLHPLKGHEMNKVGTLKLEDEEEEEEQEEESADSDAE